MNKEELKNFINNFRNEHTDLMAKISTEEALKLLLEEDGDSNV